jgi:hypothetical protein
MIRTPLFAFLVVLYMALVHAAVLGAQHDARAGNDITKAPRSEAMRPRLEASLFSQRRTTDEGKEAPAAVPRRHQRRRHRHV